MKRIKKLLLIIALVTLALILCSCEAGEGVTVTKSYVNDQLHAIVEFSDGATKDLGYVGTVDESKNVTVISTVIDKDLHAIVMFSDGTTKDLGYVGTVDESKNVKVTKSYVDAKTLHAIVEFSDGTTKDLGYVGTVDESKNVKVTKSYVDTQTLHAFVEFSDGTKSDLGYVGTVDESKNVKVTKSYVDEETLHAIVEFSDGTTKDLGYVGVEVEPPLYTVTFLDKDGNVLSTQEVYKGKSAKAPTPPTVPDQPFAGWDKDFSSVQSDLTVKATYSAATVYTVIFKDETGATLKTESVIAGHSATAPTPPTRTDTLFTGWDKTFTSVSSDMTVTAQYRQKNNYTVTFKDYSGVALGTATVKEGDSATAPVTPTREGYNFTGWSSSLTNITSNKTVTAQYSFKGGNNALDVSYTVGTGNTVTVKFTMKGTVKFCGMEGNIEIPTGLTYKSHVDGDGTTANYSEGKIYYMFSSNNGKNITSETLILTVTFTYDSSFTSGALGVNITDIYDQNFADVSSKVNGTTIKVK